MITSALMSGKTSRIKAADALLSSPEFKSMLFRLQNAPVDRAEVRRVIERKLMQSGAFKRWEKTLSTDEAKPLPARGLLHGSLVTVSQLWLFCLLFLDELCIHHLLIAKLKTLKP